MPDQQQPQGPPQSLVLNGFDGLKNTVQAERMTPRDLVRARNVTLDDVGQLSRRRGFTKRISGDAHSLFTLTDGRALVVIDSVLGVLSTGYGFTPLRPVVGAGPSAGATGLSYVQIDDTVYFSSPADSGKVSLSSLAVSAWGVPESLWLSPVVLPTKTLQPIAGKLLRKPPNASWITWFNGRIYLAVNKVVWTTELYLYDWVDATKGFYPFEGEVTMVGAVGDGVYVGTDEGLWFVSPQIRMDGSSSGMKRVRVMDSPVVPGSLVTIPAELGNPPQVPATADTPVQVALMFMTTNGACVAANGGTATNLTESKFFFPNAASAAALYRRQDGMNQYVAAMRSDGGPTTNAAIGDHLDATIIRASHA
jgi:hypothetical protein